MRSRAASESENHACGACVFGMGSVGGRVAVGSGIELEYTEWPFVSINESKLDTEQA